MPEPVPPSFQQRKYDIREEMVINGSNSTNRSKGITMEDLKRQTALRLAQEQTTEPSTQQLGNVGQFPSHHNNNHAYSATTPTESYPQQTNPLQHQQNQQQHIGAPSYDLNYMQPQNQNIIPAGPPPADIHLLGSHHTNNYVHEPLIDLQMMPCTAHQPLQPVSTMCISPNSMQQQHQSSLLTSHDSSHITSIVRNTNSNSMSTHKLPHGLTVYELKEMTKARLQFEAAEKSEEGGENQATPRDRGVSPLDFETSELIRENGNYNSFGTAVAYLPNHQMAPTMLQAQQQQQSSSQVFQSGFHPSNTIGGGAVLQSFRATTGRTDTWESTSVASHNSTIYSENLGSESTSEVGSFGQCSSNRNRSFTYPAGQVYRSSDGAHTSNEYKESYSFSNPSSTQASPHGSTGIIGAPSPSFNAAVARNRRRAVTLSPNTGSILEERPLRHETLGAGDRLEIPTFNFSPATFAASLSVAPPIQTNQRGYSPVFEKLGLDNSFLSNGSGPSGVFRNVMSNNGSALPVSPLSQVGLRDHEITKNNPYFLKETASTETRFPAPPPGFSTSITASNRHTAFSRCGSVDSVPESSSSKNGKNCLGHNRSHIVSEDNLVSDFGSVLDLSGSLGRPDRERANTYTFGSNQTFGNNSCIPGGFRF